MEQRKLTVKDRVKIGILGAIFGGLANYGMYYFFFEPISVKRAVITAIVFGTLFAFIAKPRRR